MIVYVGNIISGHGKTATTIETLGKQLQEEGFKITLTSNKKNKALRLLDMLFTVFKHRKHITTVLIDTYSTTNFYYAYLVSWLCRRLKLAYIPILHGGNLEYRLRNNPKQSEAIFTNALVNVAPSEFLLHTFENYRYDNIIHIPNTIQLGDYPFTERKACKAKLLWVRSFADIYNPEMAIHAVKRLLDLNLDVSLCMVGPEKDGSLAKTKTLAASLDVPVTFTGKVSKDEWLKLSKDYDIFINTTNFDNTPVSVIEAMALGLPIISTNVGGIPYLLVHEKTGLLIEKGSDKQMANAIVTLCTDEVLANTLSKNGRTHATTFDWETVKHSWITLLR